MKLTKIDFDAGDFRLKLEADTIADVSTLVQFANSAKKGVTTFGAVNDDCVYVWIRIPCRKGQEFKAVCIGNNR